MEIPNIEIQKKSKRNLKWSLFSLGLLVVTIFTGVGLFVGPFGGIERSSYSGLIALYYVSMALAAIFALLALVNSFNTIKGSKERKNYFAIGISIVVLLIIILSWIP